MSRIPAVDAFVDAHLRLLDLERHAEVDEARRLLCQLPAEDLERRGVTMLRLRIAEEAIGLGGRTLVTLEPSTGGDLPPSRFSAGDIVSVRTHGDLSRSERPPTGVVWRVRVGAIVVALDDDADDLREPVRLDRVANDVTYRRLRDALGRLRDYGKGPAIRLRDTLFDRRGPSFEERSGAVGSVDFLDRTLDGSQKEAVAFALSAKDVALIHGPPGTGKTTAVVEVIRQALRRGERVCVCAPSNVAVDNVVERLVRAGVQVVRLGHPARLLPAVIEHSLDHLVARTEGAKIAAQLRKEIAEGSRQVRRAKDKMERWQRRDAVRRLRRELRELEDRTTHQLVSDADVVLATLTGSADSHVSKEEFDLLVIDEAAQAIEASCWIPLLRARRVVLSGDHLQLPPTIRSRDAEKGGLGRTLFERLVDVHGQEVTRMLGVQYRMHESIMTWSSEALYEGRIVAHDSVRDHVLADLDGVSATEDTIVPVVLIDTAGCDFEEEREVEGDSRSNEGEAGIVATHIGRLVEAGVVPGDIAVITPYNAQVGLLRSRLLDAHPGIEVGSVDGFQGREKEAVVISLVRSNPRGEVGFLADERRLNVAVTRARRHVAIIGDSATVASHPFLGRLVEYIQAHGEYRSAWEYR